jgi:DNA-directed RNA polymerase specialized sigma24 family protein
MVCAAGSMEPGKLDSAHAALAELTERYWYPIYAFMRRQSGDSHQAEDLTQGFFCELIEKSGLARADPERGRFRTFLLTAGRHYMARQKEHDGALKRGGGRTLLAFGRKLGESRMSMEPSDGRTPERAFERDWALKPWLSGQGDGDQAELAQRLGLELSACKVALHRLRKRMGLSLRAEVAETVETPAEVDAELALLFEALASGA